MSMTSVVCCNRRVEHQSTWPLPWCFVFLSSVFFYLFIALGYFELLPGDTTEGEEDHEVSLLWVTDEGRTVQEEVDCCLSWDSLSTHSTLSKECTVGYRWRKLLTANSYEVRDTGGGWGSGNKPHHVVGGPWPFCGALECGVIVQSLSFLVFAFFPCIFNLHQKICFH